MNYFKDKNNEIYGLEDKDTLPIIEKDDEGNETEKPSPWVKEDWIAITKEEVDAINKAKEDEAKAQPEYKIEQAKQYLASTDWYYPRLTETGKELPADVVAKRIEARELINNLEVTNG